MVFQAKPQRSAKLAKIFAFFA